MTPEQVIRRPLILTEKGNRLRAEDNQYLFEVHPRANKIEIKAAVESLFKVDVTKVHTLVVRGRMRRMGRGREKTRNWKKAIVTLREGESIEFFEGA
jgi:large subunit ribosomal protein L23